MKKVLIILFIICSIADNVFSGYTDSLKIVISNSKSDTIKAKALRELCLYHYKTSNDSLIKYCNQVIAINSNDKVVLNCKAESYDDLAFIANKNNNQIEEENNYLKAIEFYNKINKKKPLIKSYGNLANLYFLTGRFEKAIQYYKLSQSIALKLKDSDGIIMNHLNIGNVYKKNGKYNESLESYMSALKLSEENKIEKFIAISLNSIGVVHWENRDFKKAIEYIQQSYSYREKLKDKKGASACLLNLGLIFEDQKDYDNAIIYFQKSLKLKREVDDKYGIAKCFNNIGLALKNKKDYKQAIEYYAKSLEIKQEYSDKDGISLVLSNIANLYISIADSTNISNKEKKENYLKAIEYGTNSYLIAQEINSKPWILLASTALATAYKRLGNHKKAMDFAEEIIALKDSMFSYEKSKAITEMDVKYQTEKKQLEIDNLEKQTLLDKKTIEVKEAENKKQKILIYSFIFGLLIVITFSFFLYKLFLQKKKANQLLEIKNHEITQQKEEILAQRDEIECQRDEITKHRDLVIGQKQEIEDSINYAKRIQDAVLPISDKSRSILGEHFILFLPKDIVSGDFYWTAKVDNTLIIAAADCTGHGVPGAFMSMLGISFLNEIVRKKEVVKASQVLNELRTEIVNALHQNFDQNSLKGLSLDSVKDGMDISLIAIELQVPSYGLQDTENENINTLTPKHSTNIYKAQWAGANNPLYLIKRLEDSRLEDNESQSLNLSIFESSNSTLVEIKGDKMPIAIYERMDEFTNHEIELHEGDMIYLFTDGYADQFGGPKGKKFLYKNFKELLLASCQKPMSIQKEILEETIIDWTKNSEQIDDITVIGFKV